jgi:large subunit ribosomal protein L44e
MDVPKTKNMFCKWCKKHTTHAVQAVKKHQTRKKSEGQRRFKRKMAGYGSFPKPMPSGKKPTQRQDLRYKCKECNKSDTKARAFRVKKFELKDKE